MKIILVAGARPNFMKIAPIMEEMRKDNEFKPVLVHTGQHYDENMSKIFFDDLEIPKPDINLEVGSGTHAWQTAEIMKRFEEVLIDEKTDLVMVVGDTNSTLACSLTAARMHKKVAHVEAGLRSNNWAMPEEINRVLTDRLSDYLFTTCEDANENLLKEGIDEKKIYFVGNVMIDTLLKNKQKADKSRILDDLELEKQNYAVLTLHRPNNVDNEEKCKKIFEIIEKIQNGIKIIYPVHPRTRKKIEEFGLTEKINGMKNLKMIAPAGYLDFLKLMSNSKFVMTDSGGIQEETTVLGIPCLTLREETERPVTVTEGWNAVVGLSEKKILDCVGIILKDYWKKGRIPEKWDGKAAERIINILQKVKKCD
jgi:UDP-N-acetylglucosamine 2-epimerase (non-hydrolysing)